MKITLFDEQREGIEQRFSFITILLKGIGQIMLQECAFTGLLFLAGIFYGSLIMGFAAILSVFCSTITAQLLGFDKAATAQGIYGFSAALVGVALTFYFEPTLVIWIAVIVGSALAAIVQHWFSVKNIPVFTLPFILVTWGLMYLLRQIYPVSTLSAVTAIPHDIVFALRGFGQVIFQGSIFSGAVFFIGVLISSPIRAIYGLAGALIAGGLSFFYNAPTDEIVMGLFSYNAVLCAIVFAGKGITNSIWAFVAIAFSLAVSFIMHRYQLTPLTFPFVAGTCCALALQNSINKIRDKATKY